MSIKIIAVGKLKEAYLEAGIAEYLKRLTPFVNITIVETKEISGANKERNILEEGQFILRHLKKDDYVISLALEGVNLSSCEIASLIEKTLTYKTSQIVFIIGASDGLADNIKERSDLLLSFGALTYPHQLIRLILVEQIYRAYTIINNQKYHK